MGDPLEDAQQQADGAFERTARLRKVFLEGGVREYIQQIADEHRRKIGGRAGAPGSSRETEDSG